MSWNKISHDAHSKVMNEKELWDMFKKTGDVWWYEMYRTMKEDEQDKETL